MKNILTILQNITKKEERHLLQVETSFSYEDLEKYINSINSTNFRYKIYYNNDLFKGKLEDLMFKFNLNLENKIFLEYKIDESIDFNITVNNKISCFTIKRDMIYIGTYSENMKIKSIRDNNSEESSECNVRMIDYKENLVLYKENELIIGKNRFIFSDAVTFIFQFKGIIFFGTLEGSCYWFKESLNKLQESGNDKIVGIYECVEKGEDLIYFISITGTILKYNLISNEVKRIQEKYFITSCVSSSLYIIHGTSNSCLQIYNRDYKFLETVEIPIRYVECILVLNDDVIFISDQYNVLLFDIRKKNTLNKLYFDNEVSGMEIYEDRIFISNGNKIDGFKIKNILEC